MPTLGVTLLSGISRTIYLNDYSYRDILSFNRKVICSIFIFKRDEKSYIASKPHPSFMTNHSAACIEIHFLICVVFHYLLSLVLH